MADTKAVKENKSTDVPEGVESGAFDAQMSEEDIKNRIVEKFRAGSFVLNEHEARSVAKALGVEDELGDEFFGEAEGPSSTAGLTPATGSGGAPYVPDAATDETKKAAKDADKVVKEADESSDPNPVAVANARRLQASVNE